MPWYMTTGPLPGGGEQGGGMNVDPGGMNVDPGGVNLDPGGKCSPHGVANSTRGEAQKDLKNKKRMNSA